MHSHDPTYPLFPTLSFLGFILSLIPLPWHAQAWNSGTCAFMIWTAVACLNLFVNSLIWKGNVFNVAPIWCDISSKIYIGVSIGIPASILCISRRLYSLLSLKASSVTIADKRRMILIDICISLGIPVVAMALHYVIQGHRFDIMEDVGCYPAVYNVTLAYPLYLIWSPLLGLVSAIYSCLTLHSFWRRRAHFSHLVSTNSGMTISRYMRLMALAGVDITFNVPLGLLVIWLGGHGQGPAPWISWANTHYNFSRVGLFPAILWRADPGFEASIELTRWLPVFCSFVFFALFGFATEARKNYRIAFSAVAKVLGVKPCASPARPKTLLPSWVKGRLNSSNTLNETSKQGSPSPSKSFSLLTSPSRTASNVELYTIDLHKSLPPPPRYSTASHILPLDLSASRDSHLEFPVSPTSSVATTVVGSATMCRQDSKKKLQSKSSIDSLSSFGRVDVPQPVHHHLVPRLPVSEAAPFPLYHRPFSPPLSYPPTTPHQASLGV